MVLKKSIAGMKYRWWQPPTHPKKNQKPQLKSLQRRFHRWANHRGQLVKYVVAVGDDETSKEDMNNRLEAKWNVYVAELLWVK